MVDAFGLSVVCHQADVAVLVVWVEVGDVACVELGQHAVVCPMFADAVEQLYEVAITLAVDVLQLNRGVGYPLQCPAGEEVRGGVVGSEQAPFVPLYDGR